MQWVNGVAVVGLVALLVLALMARTWFGMTELSQLDPTALLVSVGLASAMLMFALPLRAGRRG